MTFVAIGIRPILYEVLVQSSVPPRFAPDLPDLEKHPEILKDVGKFAKHLFIGDPTNAEDINDLLLACPNVKNLALWYNIVRGFHSIQPYLEALRRLPLKRLYTSTRGLRLQNLQETPFLNLTHLYIFDFDAALLDHIMGLPALPNLTHLCISATVGADRTRDLLHEGPRFRVLVVFGGNQFHSYTATDEGLKDTRLVLMAYPYSSFYHNVMALDWEHGARGGVDFWVVAERFSIARRNKFLVDNSQRWIPLAMPWVKELNAQGQEWYSTLLP